MSPRLSSRVALGLALAIAVLVLQARIVIGGKTWDDVRYHTEVAPPRLAAAEAVQAGAWPAWWEGSALGVPLVAEPSHGAAYPATWLAATPFALDLVLVLHLVWAALGVAVWARRLGAREPGALVGGILLVTTGVLASATLRGALPALAHVPWVGALALGLARATDRRQRARAAALLGIVIGAIGLAGELGVLVDALVLAVLVAAPARNFDGRGSLAAEARRGSVAARAATWRAIAVAIGGGLAIAAAQWLPAVLAIGGETGARVHAMPLARIVELVVAGGATTTRGWAPSLFIGAPLLALAAIGRAPRRIAVAMIAGVGLALVIGRGSAGWPAWCGAPELQLGVVAAIAAPYAASGIDALLRGDRRARIAMLLAAAVTALGVAALAIWRATHAVIPDGLDRALLVGALGVAAMIGAAVCAWRAPGKLAVVVLALVAAPSVGAVPQVAPVVDRAEVADPPAWATLAIRATHVPRRLFRPASLTDRDESLDEAMATLSGASGSPWGLTSVRYDDPARPPIFDRMWIESSHEPGVFLDRYGIELAILPRVVVESKSGFAELGRHDSWSLVTLPRAPAASVMIGYRWASHDAAALALLFPIGGGTSVPRGSVVLAGQGEPHDGTRAPLPCEIDAWTAGDIELQCESQLDGYAVVSSTATAGWTVDIDGAPAPWIVADVIRRAVAMPAGDHHVHWHYKVPGMAAGATFALVGLAGLAVFAALAGFGAARPRPRGSVAT